MNSFEMMAEARLLAQESQGRLAGMMLRGLGRALLRVLDRLGRALPDRPYAPW